MKAENEIYLALPSYDGRANMGTFLAAAKQPNSQHGKRVTMGCHQGSLIPRTFSKPWMEAVAAGFRYFAMLHDDIVPQRDWLDVLIGELNRCEADVVSAVVPIKCGQDVAICTRCGANEGECNCNAPLDRPHDTSTAVRVNGRVRRLTLQQCYECPPTFSDYQGMPLYVNTGCWVAKFGDYPGIGEDESVQSWFRRTPEEQWPWQCMGGRGFELHAAIDWRQIRLTITPEDWLFSQRLHDLGCKVCATTAVKLAHLGRASWENVLAPVENLA